MSDEEAERYNQWQNDLDNLCDRIKICVCWSTCILVFVYLIVSIVVMAINYKELNGE